MTRYTKILLPVLAIAFYFGAIGAAHAQGSGSGDGSQVVTLIDLLMNGRYIPAVGVFLVATVGALRIGLGTLVPWFKTKLGGFVLGFGSAALLYVGAAMKADQFSLGVIAAALGAGWASAGGWNHLQDLLAWLRPSTPSAKLDHSLQSATALGVVACLALGGLMTQTSCNGSKSPGAAVIDCTGGNTPGIVTNILDTLSAWNKLEADGGCRTAIGWNWSCVETKAIAKGEQIGGCALAEMVQSALGGMRAMPVESSWQARAALEDFRARFAGGATFHTQHGDL